jgi:hypothetical protein
LLNILFGTCDNHPPSPLLRSRIINTHRYDFSKRTTWYENARARCLKWGGDLASITSEEQAKKVSQYLN